MEEKTRIEGIPKTLHREIKLFIARRLIGGKELTVNQFVTEACREKLDRETK
jgi:hypothetical protein